MLFILRVISLRHLVGSPGRSFLTLFGITLGVAVIFATQTINRSVMTSFHDAVDEVAGKTSLTVGAGTGVEESLLETVREVEGVAAALPVIEESVRVLDVNTQLAVLAVDTLTDGAAREHELSNGDVRIQDDLAFLNDPLGVLVTTTYAQRTGIKSGDKLELDTVAGKQSFNVRGTLVARGPAKVFGGDILLMDVYAAQIAFARGRRFDRLDIVPSPGADVEQLAKRIEEAVGGVAAVARPQRRTQEAEHILGGFKLALSLASLVATFVGCFIVYNALAIAVARRRREVGILRALGTTRGAILALFLGEGALMGLLGALAGVGIGLLLARGVLSTVGATISAIYMPITASDLIVGASDVAIAMCVGLVSSVAAALFPARRAAFVAPVVAMQKQTQAADVTLHSTKLAVVLGGLSIALAILAGWQAHVREEVRLGYLVTVLLAVALAVLAPLFARGVAVVARPFLERLGPAAQLGVLSFERNAGRNSIAIAALGMALANVVNADALLDSMKHSTESWLNRSFRADIFLFAGHDVQARFDHPLPESIGDALRKQPHVQFVQAFRMLRQSYEGRPFNLMSEDIEGYRKLNELAVVDGDFLQEAAAIADGSALAASQAFAKSFNIKRGDTLTLQTAQGMRSFRIALIYVDYRADLGCLMTDRAVYKRLWNDTLVDLYGIYLEPDAPTAPVRKYIDEVWAGSFRLRALENREYIGELVGLIERALALSRATEIVALIVAILGTVNTLLVSVIDRRTEFGVLKAIGASRRQVQHVVLVEATLIGAAASLAGLGLGIVLSAYAIYELLPLQVGWRMLWQPSTVILLNTVIIAQVAAILAAWWPMRSVGKLQVTEAIAYE